MLSQAQSLARLVLRVHKKSKARTSALKGSGGPRKLRFESLEDRRLLAADLATVVPNLDFESSSLLPTSISQMSRVNDWDQLTAATTDYMHTDGWTGFANDTGTAPTPTNGSKGFIGVVNRSSWIEYASQTLLAPLIAGEEYYLDLYAGTTSSTNTYGAGFRGDLVVYGIVDASLIPSYATESGSLEDFAAGNFVELLSVPVDQAASTWTSIPDQSFTPSIAIEAIVFGSRSDGDWQTEQTYLLIDADGATPPPPPPPSPPNLGPQVTGVSIGGPNTVDGVNGWYDIPLGDGTQLDSVPIGGANKVKIHFSEEVNPASVLDSSLTMIGLQTGNQIAISGVNVAADGLSATWDFVDSSTSTTVIQGDNYLLRLAESVTDLAGNMLDGEWINPLSVTTTSATSTISGDGIPGGELEFVFSLFPGAIVQENTINAADFGVFSANYSSGNSYAQGDFNGDGLIDWADFSIIVVNFSTITKLDLRTIAIVADLLNDYGVVDDDDTDEFLQTRSDLNWDGVHDAADLGIFFALYGIDLSDNLLA